jgi:hypothetical protein
VLRRMVEQLPQRDPGHFWNSLCEDEDRAIDDARVETAAPLITRRSAESKGAATQAPTASVQPIFRLPVRAKRQTA